MGKKTEIKKEIIPEYKSSSSDSDSGSEIVISKKNKKDKVENKLSLKKNFQQLTDNYTLLVQQNTQKDEMIKKIQDKYNKQKLILKSSNNQPQPQQNTPVIVNTYTQEKKPAGDKSKLKSMIKTDN